MPQRSDEKEIERMKICRQYAKGILFEEAVDKEMKTEEIVALQREITPIAIAFFKADMGAEAVWKKSVENATKPKEGTIDGSNIS